VVEGHSSLTAHTIFANNLLERVVDQDASLKMHDTLDTLRHLLDSMKKQSAAQEMTFPNGKATTTSAATAALRACELPPIHKTTHMLKFAKSGFLTFSDLFMAS
jgi:hypothetical protein